jgi:hypothetical protein
MEKTPHLVVFFYAKKNQNRFQFWFLIIFY